MTTLGAKGWPCLPGVLGAADPEPFVGLVPGIGINELKVSAPGLAAALSADTPGIGAPGCVCVGPSGAGMGLVRESTRLDVEDEGVACAEPAGDWLEEPPRGDWVPEEESFFLASLLPSRSLLRESCSCC